jgi:flagellar biosynthesis/type III secretory pathway chaperone
MPFKRLAPVTDKLVETLQEKADTFDDLTALFERQLNALRNGDTDALTSLATEAQDCTATLDELRQAYQRQARLLVRVLELEQDDPSLQALIDALEQHDAPEASAQLARARTAVRERAEAAQAKNDTLRFALEHAAGLNHELLAAVQEATVQTDSRTYTADGEAESGGGEHSLVNTIG